MNREEIVRVYNGFLDVTGRNNDEVVLGFGGALVMHGLRDTTNDLDLDVTSSHFNMWKGLGSVVETTPLGERLILNDSIDLHAGIPIADYITVIDGVACYSLAMLLVCYINFSKNPKRNPAKLEPDAEAVKMILARINETHRVN